MCRAAAACNSTPRAWAAADPTIPPAKTSTTSASTTTSSTTPACDGITLATLDPAKGKIEVYNNIIYRTGKGPKPPSGGNFSGIYVPSDTYAYRDAKGGVVEIYNNTLYDCGSLRLSGSSNAFEHGGHNKQIKMNIRNNIVVQPRGQLYVDAFGPIMGGNNLFYGNGALPASPHLHLGVTLQKDPLFVDPANGDFHLAPNSPARHAGQETGISVDSDGFRRDKSKPPSLGALQR